MQNLVLLCIIVRSYCLWIGEIADYPLFDAVSCTSKGHYLFLVTPVARALLKKTTSMPISDVKIK